jgi:hypothetical protein
MNHNPQKIPRVSPYEIWYNIRAQTRRAQTPCWVATSEMGSCPKIMQLGLCPKPVRNSSTGAWQKLSKMGWILLVIALLRDAARVDMRLPGHKLRFRGPITWFPPIGRS